MLRRRVEASLPYGEPPAGPGAAPAGRLAVVTEAVPRYRREGLDSAGRTS